MPTHQNRPTMGIREQIKIKLTSQINQQVDDIYEFVHSRFALQDEDETALIDSLNQLKDRLHAIVDHSGLS